MIKFLDQVKVKAFSQSIKTTEQREAGTLKYKTTFIVRKVRKYKNPAPETLYVVIGTTTLQEGYSDYLGQDDGYGWAHEKTVKVYIVANTLGRRYKAQVEDMEIC